MKLQKVCVSSLATCSKLAATLRDFEYKTVGCRREASSKGGSVTKFVLQKDFPFKHTQNKAESKLFPRLWSTLMTLRFWNCVALAAILIILGSLLFVVPRLFVIAVAGILLLLIIRPSSVDELNAHFKSIFGTSNRAAQAAQAIVIALAVIGFAVIAVSIGLLLRHPGPGEPSKRLVSAEVDTKPHPQTPEQLYLDLLKRALTRALVAGPYERYTLKPNLVNGPTLDLLEPLLHERGFDLVGLRASHADAYVKPTGSNWGRMDDGETMVGLAQLDNAQFCVEDVLRHKVPGDLIEAGAWRGGVTILMRGVLKVYDEKNRKVWVADSFEGLPPVDKVKDRYWYHEGQMAVSLEEVEENFARYGLLDDQVRFLKGFFNKTLPSAPIQELAVLRVDADLYASTLDALNSLYPRLSVGGYAIFDDYVQEPAVRMAIDEYRRDHSITEPIQNIDGQAVYWKREK